VAEGFGAVRQRGKAAARTHAAQEPAEAAPDRDRRVRRERRARPRPAADDRRDRPEALADDERGPQRPRVGEDARNVFHVLRILVVGDGEGQLMPAGGDPRERDSHASRAIRDRHEVFVDVSLQRLRIDA